MERTSPARAILATVAGSASPDPIERGRAQVALLVAGYDPTATLVDIIGEADKPPTAPPLDLAGIVKAMGCLA